MALHSGRHWASFIAGAVIFTLGLLPLINEAPAFLNNVLGQIAIYIIAFGGLYVIVDSFFEYTFHSGVFITSFLVGLVVFGVGLVTILNQMGKLTFHILPPQLSVLYYILFMLEGLFMMLAAFFMD